MSMYVLKMFYADGTVSSGQPSKETKNNAHFQFGQTAQSTVACHAIEENHKIHWDPLVIAKEGHKLRRKAKEALNISLSKC